MGPDRGPFARRPPTAAGKRAAAAKRVLGAAGEDAVARWYEAAGYEIVDRNWRVRAGELDIVARRDRVLVFCEVKTRTSDAFGAPVEAITRVKRLRIRGLAAQWLEAHGGVNGSVRFDVASVMPDPHGGLAIDVLEAAF
ncbi:MAG: hypothetical protein JWL73_437 [Actinomycetia bacterium]|nr:hypothetical protein [Actinomycetes bacterium]